MESHKISFFKSLPVAFNIWKNNFLTLTIVVLAVTVPTQIIIETVAYLLRDIDFSDQVQKIKITNNIYNAIRGLIWPIAAIGIINFTFSVLSGNKKEEKVIRILLFGLIKWPKFFLTYLLAGLWILGYMFLLIIPGIYKGVRLTFIDCIVATQNKSVTGSCDYSEELVKNNWWLIFGFLVFMFIAEMFTEALLSLPILMIPESFVLAFTIAVFIKVVTVYFVIVRAAYFFEIEKFYQESIMSPELNKELNCNVIPIENSASL